MQGPSSRTRSAPAFRRLFRWESWNVTPLVFAAHVRLYRLLRGRLVGRNILILTTVGRRSGRRRSTPLFYVRDGDGYAVIASNGGEARYPGWWHNIRSNPEVEIQVGADAFVCRAERANEDDVPHLWARFTAVYRGYIEYRKRTARELTIFRLRPRPVAAGASRREYR